MWNENTPIWCTVAGTETLRKQSAWDADGELGMLRFSPRTLPLALICLTTAAAQTASMQDLSPPSFGTNRVA